MAETRGNPLRNIIAIILLVVFLAAIGWFGYGVLFHGKAPTPDYEVLSTNVLGDGSAVQVIYKVCLNANNPTMDNLRETAINLKASTDEPWLQIIIYYYLQGMDPAENEYAIAQINREGVIDIRLAE